MAEEDRAVRDATKDLIDRLADFDPESRRRIVRTALTFFDMEEPTASGGPSHASSTAHRRGMPDHSSLGREPVFSGRDVPSPKDFLFQKQPQTDVDRMACLAYYLTHYRETRQFKTVDLSKLNTEAAQVKFSNAAYSVSHTAHAGILVPAGKGFKQLSALGERYVEALPDRAVAKDVVRAMRSRRARRLAKNKHVPA